VRPKLAPNRIRVKGVWTVKLSNLHGTDDDS
jgi:hypothetical protein